MAMCKQAVRLTFVLGLLVSASAAVAEDIVFADGQAADGYTLMIGDKKQWDTVVYADPVSSASGYIAVTPDPAEGAVNASWNGKGEAQLFLAGNAPQDLTSLAEQDAALVVLMQIQAAPKRKVTLKMSCGYPCSANADISKLLKALPVDQWLRVSIDLQCFTDGGLDATNVDSPLMLLTRSKMSLSVADVRFVPGAGESATIRCR